MADAFFTEQHELVRKLAREFAETELTKEILDKVEEEEVFPRKFSIRWQKPVSSESRFRSSTADRAETRVLTLS